MCARRVESIGQSFARSTAAVLLLVGCGADFARARGGLARVIYECEVTGQLGARALAQVQVGKKFRGDGMQIASRAYRPSMSYACTLQVERSRSRTVVLSGRRHRPRHRASQATTSISSHENFMAARARPNEPRGLSSSAGA